MKPWLSLTIVCWALVSLLLSLSQPGGLNHQSHLVCSRPWLDPCREPASGLPTAAALGNMEFELARADSLASLVLDGEWTAGNIGPPGQETHGPPEPIGPWRVAGQSRQPKATFSYPANTKLLAQPTELEESGFCNSL
jgi:hypothetical protein